MDKFTVITKGVIDGTGSPMKNRCTFDVENGLITRVGGTSTIASNVIDLSDYYVMPGLIDSHTHLSIVPSEGNQTEQMALPPQRNVLRALPNIRRQLESGVTAMRIMGEEHFIDIELRRAIEEGIIKGPRLFVSGIGIVASNGHGIALTTSDTEYEVRKNIRRNFHNGADFVKLFMTGGMSSTRPPVDFCGYSKSEVCAAVDEAERMKTYVAAHAHGGPGLDMCIDCGVKSIEHGGLLSVDQIIRMKEKNMWVVFTSAITFHPTGLEQTEFKNEIIRKKVLEDRRMTRIVYDRVFSQGLKYALGTDSMHGLMYYEMKLAVDFGADNMSVIVAATKTGAEICLMDDKIGTIEPGKYADFIALKDNPIDNIDAMALVDIVYKDGKMIVDKRKKN